MVSKPSSVRGNQKKPSSVIQTTASPRAGGWPRGAWNRWPRCDWDRAREGRADSRPCGDGALDVVLHGLNGGSRGGEPELLVGIEAEVSGDFENAGEIGGEPFGVPAIDGQVPPHGPHPAGETVDGLEVHEARKRSTWFMAVVLDGLAIRVRKSGETGLPGNCECGAQMVTFGIHIGSAEPLYT